MERRDSHKREADGMEILSQFENVIIVVFLKKNYFKIY